MTETANPTDTGQYLRIAKLEALRFLPDRAGGYSAAELNEKDAESDAMLRRDMMTRGMSRADANVLFMERRQRIINLGTGKAPSTVPQMTTATGPSPEYHKRQETVNFAWALVFALIVLSLFGLLR